MKRVIGIVSEGPTDYLVIKEVVNFISGDDNTYIRLQPEPDLQGRFGNGWKGVWKWCEDTAPILDKIFDDVIPKMDLLVIQMDADVSRKEKEVHCLCEITECVDKKNIHPLACKKIMENQCPVSIPCEDHESSPEGFDAHLRKLMTEWLGINGKRQNIVVTIPCDSTDAWIVAAFENSEGIETIENPWDSVIAQKKEYCGIRVPGKKKSTSVYSKFLPKLVENWTDIVERCWSAEQFDRSIKAALNENKQNENNRF